MEKEKIISLNGLAHYDEKIKEILNKKINNFGENTLNGSLTITGTGTINVPFIDSNSVKTIGMETTTLNVSGMAVFNGSLISNNSNCQIGNDSTGRIPKIFATDMDVQGTLTTNHISWVSKDHLYEYTFKLEYQDKVLMFKYVGQDIHTGTNAKIIITGSGMSQLATISVTNLLDFISSDYIHGGSYQDISIPAWGSLPINGHGKTGEIPTSISYNLIDKNFIVHCCYVGNSGGLSNGTHFIIGSNNIFGSPANFEVIGIRALC